MISTYFSPSAERGLTSSVESFGSGSTRFSSFIEIVTNTVPSGRRTGVMSVTDPTRTPPMRTSLFFTRLAPLGSSAFTL